MNAKLPADSADGPLIMALPNGRILDEVMPLLTRYFHPWITRRSQVLNAGRDGVCGCRLRT